MGIIVVQKDDFPRQDFPGGGYRCTAPVLYEEHSAQISIVNHVPDRYIEQHSHTVDEVILMLEGQLEVDGNPGAMPKGCVVFVGANNVYGFQCGPEGLTWIFVRPDRPDVDISATDTRPATGTVQRDSRFEAHSTSEIEAVPWSPVEGSPDLQERVVISSGGSPRVSFYRATSSNTLVQKADRGRFLYVLEATLAVEGQECGAGGVISVPGGEPRTPPGRKKARRCSGASRELSETRQRGLFADRQQSPIAYKQRSVPRAGCPSSVAGVDRIARSWVHPLPSRRPQRRTSSGAPPQLGSPEAT